MRSAFNSLKILGFLTFSALSFATKFGETTTGRQDETTELTDKDGKKTEINYGITKEDEAALDQTQKDLLDKFRSGRVSSFKDLRSRYSGHLEMHDENLDGLTDHGLRKGQVNLEGQMDTAGYGTILDDPQKRNWEINGIRPSPPVGSSGSSSSTGPKDSERIVNNSGSCKNGTVDGKTGPDAIPCMNISTNILDAGPAHGPSDEENKKNGRPLEEHRFYKVSDKAIKGATVAGENYGEAAIEDGKIFDADALRAQNPQAKVYNVGKGKKRIQETEADGKTYTKDVAPDADYLRSEYVWLEEQKKHRYDQNWKTLRASRLGQDLGVADTDSNRSPVDNELANMVATNKSDEEIAKYIAEKKSYSGMGSDYCMGSDNRPKVCDPTKTEKKLSDFMADTSATSASEREYVWKTAKENYKKDFPDSYDRAQKNIANISSEAKNCMQRDVWCRSVNDQIYDLEKAKVAHVAKMGATAPFPYEKQLEDLRKDRDNGKIFKPVTGDVGSAFKDTREFINARASIAWEGPVDQMVKTMRTADFNEKIDGRTAGGYATSTPFADMVKQVEEIKKMQKAVEDKKAEFESKGSTTTKVSNTRDSITNYGGYKNTFTFNKGNFNTANQSVIQMFGINRARDGSSLKRGNSVQAPNPNAGPSYSAPSYTPPRPSAPSPASVSGPN